MSDSANAHIEITPGICGGKPRIAGHRIRVQDIALWSVLRCPTIEEKFQLSGSNVEAKRRVVSRVRWSAKRGTNLSDL